MVAHAGCVVLEVAQGGVDFVLLDSGEGGSRRQFTISGDRAAWICGTATAMFPEATQNVDLFHAREHLHDLARKLEFMLLDRKDEWLAARLDDLDYGYIDCIVAATRKYPPYSLNLCERQATAR